MSAVSLEEAVQGFRDVYDEFSSRVLDNQELALILADGSKLLIDNVDFKDPNLVVFIGTVNDAPAISIQNVHEVNVNLVIVNDAQDEVIGYSTGKHSSVRRVR